jgi:hypothetical protein
MTLFFTRIQTLASVESSAGIADINTSLETCDKTHLCSSLYAGTLTGFADFLPYNI